MCVCVCCCWHALHHTSTVGKATGVLLRIRKPEEIAQPPCRCGSICSFWWWLLLGCGRIRVVHYPPSKPGFSFKSYCVVCRGCDHRMLCCFFSFTRVKQISSEPHNICIKNAPPRHNLKCMLNKCKCKFSYEYNSQTIMFSQDRPATKDCNS